jgi:LPXTG-site transpeptidase (sortase) family protein
MDTWSVIYEYCDTHGTCHNADCRKTVVVQARIEVPQINLLKPFLPHNDHVVVSARNLTAPIKIRKFSVFSIHKLRKHTIQPCAHRIPHPKTLTFRMPIPLTRFVGISLLAIGIGGMMGPLVPQLRLEARSAVTSAREADYNKKEAEKPLPQSAPVVFEPLKAPDGTIITPVNNDFSIVIPKIGVNAPIIANVDPAQPNAYHEALINGVAHASTSFFPDQDGTVYLFSHSTNYAWFVKDLNAVFYLVKNLEKGDSVVLIYKGKRYTYRISDKQIVSPRKTSYLIPFAGKKSLILETCWPPGSVAQRLLIFADLIEIGSNSI